MDCRLHYPGAVTLLLTLALVPSGSSAASPSILRRDDVVALARERAPDVLRAFTRIRQAEAEVRSVEPLTRDSASLTLGAGPRLSSPLMTDVAVSASLPVPLLLDRALALESARAGVRTAESDARVAALSAVKLGLDLYVGVLSKKERLALARERASLAERLLSMAAARVEAGDASSLELTLAEAEHAASRAAVLAAEGELAEATGALAYLLGLPDLEAEDVEGELGQELQVPPLRDLTLDEAVARALVERPDIASASLALERAGAEVEYAGLSWLPAVSLNGSYALDGGEHVALFGFGVALPLFDLGAGARAEAEAERAREEQELELLRRAAESEVKRAYAVHQKALAAVAVLGDEALPRASAAEALLDEGYGAGKLELASLLMVRRDTLALRTEHIERQTEAALAANQLALVAAGEHLLPSP